MKETSEKSKCYIVRPEKEIVYTGRPVLWKLYVFCNYWRYIKIGYCQIMCDRVYYIALPTIYRKGNHE